MAKAVEQLRSGLTVGHFKLGLGGGRPSGVTLSIHDGDTINVQAAGNFGIRFLGVDAPEISFQLPGRAGFTKMHDPRWEAFLGDPFAGDLPPFEPPLPPGLMADLQARVGPGAATNQYDLAVAAEKALEQEVRNDMAQLGQSVAEFEFFMAFTAEVMDRYGRMLGYINRNEPQAPAGTARPVSYNERLLLQAMVCPYFIFPNINPFRKAASILDAVIPPGTAATYANKDASLRAARHAVSQARQQGIGIFSVQNPLRVIPFELRFLARTAKSGSKTIRRPPDRWVIDLSQNSDVLLRPDAYHTIPNLEDRLFIPVEYVPMFEARGWRRED